MVEFATTTFFYRNNYYSSSGYCYNSLIRNFVQ